MKKIILFVFALSLFANVNAQKKSQLEVKLAKIVSTVAQEMDLKKDKETFIFNTLLAERKSRMAQNKGKDLSQEEKKVLVQAGKKEVNKTLKQQFSNDEIKQINTIVREEYKKLNK